MADNAGTSEKQRRGRYTTERQPSQVPAQHPQPAPCARRCLGCCGCRRSCPPSAVACRWCIGPEGEPAVASTAGRGCTPPLELLRLPLIRPAVRHCPSVPHWRGTFSQTGLAEQTSRSAGWGRSTRGGGPVRVSARTGVAGLNGPPAFRRHGLNRRAVTDRPAASMRTRRRTRTRGCCPCGLRRRRRRPGLFYRGGGTASLRGQ